MVRIRLGNLAARRVLRGASVRDRDGRSGVRLEEWLEGGVTGMGAREGDRRCSNFLGAVAFEFYGYF